METAAVIKWQMAGWEERKRGDVLPGHTREIITPPKKSFAAVRLQAH
jgi:hypothetical protein